MYANILIPVSFDEDRDIEKAIDVAKRCALDTARFTFLHAQDILPSYVADHIAPEVLISTHDEIKTRLNEMAAGMPNANVALVQGPAGRSITSWAEENSADLIVIASHRPTMSDIFLGSTAAWVVRHAPCAVHVIR